GKSAGYISRHIPLLNVLSASAAAINFSRRRVLSLFHKFNIKLYVFERTVQTTFCNFSFISHVNRSCNQTFTSRECKVIPQVLVAFNVELSSQLSVTRCRYEVMYVRWTVTVTA